jgi:N-succinyldiaminopimelate aminotransferase
MADFSSIFVNARTSIFEEMSALAREHGAINLGQGFPDGDEPKTVLESAAKFLFSHANQYPPMRGLPELRRAVARHDERFYGLAVNPETDVLVTSGATEALTATFFALLNPGDEAIIIDPAYDSYAPIIRRAGATPVVVSMRPPSWTWDETELANAFTDKTKLIVVNSPMNPVGRVLSASELGTIARLAIEHDAFVVADEVYEHIAFTPHTTMLGIPGMRERTLKIGSAGKTFSLTGFKVGYITASKELIRVVAAAHQFITFTVPPNLQRAVAEGLDQSDKDYNQLRDELLAKRDMFTQGLQSIGFEAAPCEGTYFALARVGGDDRAYCIELTTKTKVAAIPVSALCSGQPISGYIRFCFAKRDDMLNEALKRLSARP